MSKLVIAPTSMHKNLLRFYRQENLFSDVKITSKESLIHDWLGKVDSSAIKYILSKYPYSYGNVLSLLPFLPYASNETKELYQIKQDLIENDLMSKNEYLNTFLLNKDIDVFGCSKKDVELNNFINAFSLKPNYIEGKNDIHGLSVFKYETISDEVLYTLNKVAKLLSDGHDIKKIYLYVKDDNYIQYLKRYIDNYGFALDINDSKSLYCYEISKRFLTTYRETKDFDSSIAEIETIQDEELVRIFKETLASLYDENLPFEKQLDYFEGELKRTKYEISHINNVVKVINRPIFEEHAFIFVLGFSQGSFPEIKKDNEYLSDVIKEKIGMNTSLIKSEIEEDTLIDFFKSNNTFAFSYATRSLTDKFFPSPFIEKYSFVEKEDVLPKVIYSIDMANFLYAKLLDLKYTFSKESNDLLSLERICDIPYGKYDNRYDGVEAFDSKQDIDYSYSNIKEYYECPFSYYITNVLKIDPFEGNFYTRLGNVYHGVLEDSYLDDFDFEKSFAERATKEEFTIEEEVVLVNLKGQMKAMTDVLKEHHKHMKNPRYLLEHKSRIKLTENSFLKGKIDKTIIIDNKYIALVDYKTGSESFEPKELVDGYSMQLPTYCLLAENDESLKDYEIVGIYINNVVDKSFTVDKKGFLINPLYQLNGYTLSDLKIINMLDDTLVPGSSSNFIKGLRMSKSGALYSGSRVMDKDILKEYERITLDNYVKSDQRIRNIDFKIEPYYA